MAGRNRTSTYNIQDAFLKNKEIRSVRPNYLSTAALLRQKTPCWAVFEEKNPNY